MPDRDDKSVIGPKAFPRSEPKHPGKPKPPNKPQGDVDETPVDEDSKVKDGIVVDDN